MIRRPRPHEAASVADAAAAKASWHTTDASGDVTSSNNAIFKTRKAIGRHSVAAEKRQNTPTTQHKQGENVDKRGRNSKSLINRPRSSTGFDDYFEDIDASAKLRLLTTKSTSQDTKAPGLRQHRNPPSSRERNCVSALEKRDPRTVQSEEGKKQTTTSHDSDNGRNSNDFKRNSCETDGMRASTPLQLESGRQAELEEDLVGIHSTSIFSEGKNLDQLKHNEEGQSIYSNSVKFLIDRDQKNDLPSTYRASILRGKETQQTSPQLRVTPGSHGSHTYDSSNNIVDNLSGLQRRTDYILHGSSSELLVGKTSDQYIDNPQVTRQTPEIPVRAPVYHHRKDVKNVIRRSSDRATSSARKQEHRKRGEDQENEPRSVYVPSAGNHLPHRYLTPIETRLLPSDRSENDWSSGANEVQRRSSSNHSGGRPASSLGFRSAINHGTFLGVPRSSSALSRPFEDASDRYFDYQIENQGYDLKTKGLALTASPARPMSLAGNSVGPMAERASVYSRQNSDSSLTHEYLAYAVPGKEASLQTHLNILGASLSNLSSRLTSGSDSDLRSQSGHSEVVSERSSTEVVAPSGVRNACRTGTGAATEFLSRDTPAAASNRQCGRGASPFDVANVRVSLREDGRNLQTWASSSSLESGNSTKSIPADSHSHFMKSSVRNHDHSIFSDSSTCEIGSAHGGRQTNVKVFLEEDSLSSRGQRSRTRSSEKPERIKRKETNAFSSAFKRERVKQSLREGFLEENILTSLGAKNTNETPRSTSRNCSESELSVDSYDDTLVSNGAMDNSTDAESNEAQSNSSVLDSVDGTPRTASRDRPATTKILSRKTPLKAVHPDTPEPMYRQDIPSRRVTGSSLLKMRQSSTAGDVKNKEKHILVRRPPDDSQSQGSQRTKGSQDNRAKSSLQSMARTRSKSSLGIFMSSVYGTQQMANIKSSPNLDSDFAFDTNRMSGRDSPAEMLLGHLDNPQMVKLLQTLYKANPETRRVIMVKFQYFKAWQCFTKDTQEKRIRKETLTDKSEDHLRHRLLCLHFITWWRRATHCAQVRRADALWRRHTLHKGLKALRWSLSQSRHLAARVQSNVRTALTKKAFDKWKTGAVNHRRARKQQAWARWKQFVTETKKIRHMRELMDFNLQQYVIRCWQKRYRKRVKLNMAFLYFRQTLSQKTLKLWKFYVLQRKEEKQKLTSAVAQHQRVLLCRAFYTMLVSLKKAKKAKTHFRAYRLNETLWAWREAAQVCRAERLQELAMSVEHWRSTRLHQAFTHWRERLLVRRVTRVSHANLCRSAFSVWRFEWQKHLERREKIQLNLTLNKLRGALLTWRQNVVQLRRRQKKAVILIEHCHLKQTFRYWRLYTARKGILKKKVLIHQIERSRAVLSLTFSIWRERFTHRLEEERRKLLWSHECARKFAAQWKLKCHRRKLSRLYHQILRPSIEERLVRAAFTHWVARLDCRHRETVMAEEMRERLEKSRLRAWFTLWQGETNRALLLKPLLQSREQKKLADGLHPLGGTSGLQTQRDCHGRGDEREAGEIQTQGLVYSLARGD
ncbi:hypothetical protein PoB_003231400 [Plakobranchus ocellatus]|uniref:Sfi1 spindle body domain-containing protein n=1 Tax=Plakobranchus ocellatus TaxID=259542 RepID=A0AAV4ADS9_9GAST|nr:hypothetical protein PoB_003231400 [Plakobranchus ocellatus]